MAARPPEGPKADFDAAHSSESRIPRPPSPEALDDISEQQGMITDEWAGDTPGEERAKAGGKPGTP